MSDRVITLSMGDLKNFKNMFLENDKYSLDSYAQLLEKPVLALASMHSYCLYGAINSFHPLEELPIDLQKEIKKSFKKNKTLNFCADPSKIFIALGGDSIESIKHDAILKEVIGYAMSLPEKYDNYSIIYYKSGIDYPIPFITFGTSLYNTEIVKQMMNPGWSEIQQKYYSRLLFNTGIIFGGDFTDYFIINDENDPNNTLREMY